MFESCPSEIRTSSHHLDTICSSTVSDTCGMAQTQKEAAEQLAAILQEQPLSADLQLSAFCAAVQHYRHASIATPFPSHLFTDSKGDKDFKACLAALQRLPSVSSLTSSQHLSRLPATSVQLLSWLLNPENRRRNAFSVVSSQGLMQDLSSRSARLPQFSSQVDTPSAIFSRSPDPGASQPAFSRPVIAYHGTCMENVHSILNAGLLNVSASRLQRNGAIFGDGIYLSTRYDVAFSFSKPAPSWQHSQIGKTARCLLVCEVDLDKVQGAGPDATANQPPSAALNPSSEHTPSSTPAPLPDSYLLVSRPDAIRLLYVLVYADAHPAAASRLSWSTVVVGLYLVGLLLQWLAGNKALKVELRRLWRAWQSEGWPGCSLGQSRQPQVRF